MQRVDPQHVREVTFRLELCLAACADLPSHLSARRARRAASLDGHARSREPAGLHRGEQLCMAAVAQMLLAGLDNVALFSRVARCRTVQFDQHGAGHDPARNRGTRSLAQRRVIDSQSVKTTESGGVCGYDAGKKIEGRKRHILTDTCGFLVFILVHAANIHDLDGTANVFKTIDQRFSWLRHVFADGGYSGQKLRRAMARHGNWTIEIIERSETAKGFQILPRCWVVERTFAWLGRCRRLAKDWDTSISFSTAWALLASIRMLTRRSARYYYA